MKKVYLLLILCLNLSCTLSRDSITNDKNRQREMLKELFIYKCISRGYPEIEFEKFDNSAALYVELSRYDLKVYLKIDSLAKDFVSKITYKDTYYEDEKTKSLFFQSMEYTKNNEFNSFMESLDKYILDEYNHK